MSAPKTLAGRIAIVTGAESGIGAATATALARDGANICVWSWQDRTAADATCATIREHGAKASAIAVDIRDESGVEAAFDASIAALGRPTILVNSAGLNQSGVAVADMSTAQWRRLQDTDLTGAFFTCRRFVRDLRNAGQGGTVVNISSIHGDVVRVGAADYVAAKAGLNGLTRTLALEAAPLGVRVNAIAPGMILTPMNARAETDTAYRALLETSIPLKRAGRAEEVADLCAFLVSPAASYITGAILVIDGGLSLVLGQGA